jgi:hypothetical protein
MIGYNEKSVFVYDNSEIDIQSVPNNDLQKAWANDYIGISKKNTYFGIDMDQPNFDIADIIQQGLNRNAALYLNAPVDFIGVRGLEKLIAELPAWKTNYSAEVLKQIYLHHIEFSASTVPELPEEISGFHSGIDNPHQAGRDKLANALLKHQSNFGSKEWETAAKELRKSGKAIESIVKMFISDVHDMSYEDTDKYLPLLSEIKQIEEYVIGSLLSHRR